MPTMLDAMRAVRGSCLPPSSRHVLMTLISLADPSTCVIPYQHAPSLTDLTKFTGLVRSTVALQLKSLESEGWIKRDKPSVRESWGARERTRYIVLIPTSPTIGLVRPPDQPDNSTSPTIGPELVRPSDYTSPTIGLAFTGLTNLTSQEEHSQPEAGSGATTTRARGKRSPRSQRSAKSAPLPLPGIDQSKAEEDVNAGTINSAWIGYCSENGIKLTSRVIKRYGAEIKELLGEEFSPEMIKLALWQMFKERTASRPSLLPTYVVRIQQGGELPPERAARRSTTDERVEAGLALSAKLKADQESGALPPNPFAVIGNTGRQAIEGTLAR